MLPTQFVPIDEAKNFFPNIDEKQLEQVGVIKVKNMPKDQAERIDAQLKSAEKIFDTIDSLPCKVLWIPGNHDLPKLSALKGFSRSKCISEDRFEIDGINFVGFPYIPRMNGDTNYESTDNEMAARLQVLEDLVDENTVLATHAPPYGTGLGIISNNSEKMDVGSKR
ncbi:MAG: metallophosphoesterase, partial [Thermoplasmata archaeon]